jgi:hypothetical protein
MGKKIFFLLLISTLCLSADIVYFKGNTSIECDVIKVTKDNVTVKVAKGLFTFSKERVKKIEYDYEKKRTMLGKEDYKGHYELGVWCLNCNQDDNALAQFLYVEGKPGVPDEVYLKLAEIYLRRDNPKKAVEYYQNYLAKHPDDELIVKKLENLTEGETTSPKGEEPKSLKKADEGLEILTGWRIEKWANPGIISHRKTVQRDVENKILKVVYKAKSSDKTAARLQYTTDLTPKKICVMDVYNPDKRVISVAIAFVTNPGYNWYESKGIVLKQGWNLNVKFDLTGKDFKSKATNWMFNSKIKNRDNIVQFIVLIYNGTREGTLFFDNVKFK